MLLVVFLLSWRPLHVLTLVSLFSGGTLLATSSSDTPMKPFVVTCAAVVHVMCRSISWLGCVLSF